MQVLTPEEYLPRIAAHEARAEKWAGPRVARRARGEYHPVWDFLFDYYPQRPSHLKRWHPGAGVCLADAESLPHTRWRDYVADGDGTVRLDVQRFLDRRRGDVEEAAAILRSVDRREAHFDCFGMHEWAMVYRIDSPRHSLPLRLGAEGTNAVVETHTVKCSHFDAFRFFTPAARPLNLTVLTREGQPANDQAGCVHVSMDLYKWAMKLGPLVPGELLLDCFELAADARRLDMEASPYDCRGLGFDVVAVETPEGKAQYVARQRELTRRAQPLRRRLVAILDEVHEG
ncbi:3-methyladenine DNA glycosylase [Corynebacterium wankanglinii]|uniref:3-methyladenine DNA glycosylase n=1 Tax=Corynebacterium wankanglinii TaxID=2735136 RepID=A0A838CMM3_9CORY|nr:3-methyladenine DNA glycosylase [Corynebacterium wankanglinii]MBA1836103.1 3-methyladenine DNA glycosylase [Corynebacterium wankanglinii]